MSQLKMNQLFCLKRNKSEKKLKNLIAMELNRAIRVVQA